MIIIILRKTPTVNHLYWHRGNMKILTKEARELREYIANQVKSIKGTLPKGKLKVNVDIYENWYTKKGEVARKDIANREKFLIDSIFKALEADDRFIWRHTMNKIQSIEEKAIITIELLE